MDLLQKYSAAELFYELDETFIIQIEESLTVKQSGDLIVDIELLVPKLKKVNHKSQLLAGVLQTGGEPIYYAIRFINEERHSPYFFQFIIIDTDQYLDFYNQKKAIKNGYRDDKRNS
jgi:hypothetical protein